MKTRLPSPVPSVLSLRAPAKVNWFLRITDKRDDGYHNIESLMQCVTLYDALHLERTLTVTLECDQNIPVADNLVYRAACLLKEYTAYRKGVRIVVKKNIPVGAGLGGGSSDAAYTLMGLNTLWDLKLSTDELCALGARLGSDVPFFLGGPCAFVEGRGERTAPISLDAPLALLLVKPPLSVSTAWAYDAFDWRTEHQRDGGGDMPMLFGKELKKKPLDIKLFCQALNKRDFAALTKMLDNDLEPVVIQRYPVIKDIKARLVEVGAAVSAMSGSGPAVFGVFVSRDEAEKAKRAMKPNWCCQVDTLIE
ncbi:MAG: 4-(cytidine 5'-diphospho)-2-C-methyl-D-erythritol kinase [Thermodesulfovibrionales bacterium]|nr:4-(cytidine 5'-diphospho)-2-C-methyl-D-erythritol kinase [Thermodesulfovibrionales bacterium]